MAHSSAYSKFKTKVKVFALRSFFNEEIKYSLRFKIRSQPTCLHYKQVLDCYRLPFLKPSSPLQGQCFTTFLNN